MSGRDLGVQDPLFYSSHVLCTIRKPFPFLAFLRKYKKTGDSIAPLQTWPGQCPLSGTRHIQENFEKQV